MSGNRMLVGEIKRCEVQWETGNLAKKPVEVTLEARQVEGSEVGASLEEARKKRDGFIRDYERQSKMVGYREKLFR
ncbi:hypothetical protein A2U01_0003684, partial [Trifolium medium]|nr:hypothetical protein [Trifolium medium]